MAKPYFTREAHFTNPAGIYFAEKSTCRSKCFFLGAGNRTRLPVCRRQTVRMQPVFELAAGTVHRTVPLKWVRVHHPYQRKKHPRRGAFSLVRATGLDYIKVSAASSRRRGTVHRTVPSNGFESDTFINKTGHPRGVPCLVGAGNRTRTCTLTQWNLNPPSLPIPPCPHILLYLYFYTGRLPEVEAVRLIHIL